MLQPEESEGAHATLRQLLCGLHNYLQEYTLGITPGVPKRPAVTPHEYCQLEWFILGEGDATSESCCSLAPQWPMTPRHPRHLVFCKGLNPDLSEHTLTLFLHWLYSPQRTIHC